MTPDETLIQDCCRTHDKRTEGLPPKDKRELWDELREMIEFYRSACALSQGRDPGRAKAWTSNALRTQAKLRQLAYGGEVLV